MSCNTCAKPFSLLRKEKGCPGCGFSYCSKCLENKIFIEKIKSEAKVCIKCKQAAQEPNKQKPIDPPDAYYKRIGAVKDNSCSVGVINNQKDACSDSSSGNQRTQNKKDQEIQDRLHKLKQSNKVENSQEEISKRLQNVKGEVPSTSDDELLERLAKLRGVPVATLQTKAMLVTPDTRSEQEQIEDLLKQYHDKTAIDSKYKDEFSGLVTDMEARLQTLKGKDGGPSEINTKLEETPSEDEEETVKKIIEKLKAEVLLDENELNPTVNDELPFCEICNEDAMMRCVGCRYLFCKRCFTDHKDDDDGCDRYEPYTPPNRTSV